VRIGIDLGGTKIEGIALGTRRSRVGATQDTCATRRLPVNAAVVSLVHWIESRASEQGHVGVGIPGTISPATGLVKNANSTWLNGEPLAEDLPKLLGRPVRFANDANCFALMAPPAAWTRCSA
jgi:fructokinase